MRWGATIIFLVLLVARTQGMDAPTPALMPTPIPSVAPAETPMAEGPTNADLQREAERGERERVRLQEMIAIINEWSETLEKRGAKKPMKAKE